MKIIFRLLAVIFVVLATYTILWIPWSLFLSSSSVLRLIAASTVSLICACIAGWYAWKKLGAVNTGLISSIFIGALVLGGIGFSAGFFGPIIFNPEVNQGPLLGIFFTGPLGFLIGGIAGGRYWKTRQ